MSGWQRVKGAYNALIGNSTPITRSLRSLVGGGSPFITHGGERDMFEVLGYPFVIDWEQNLIMFKRMGIATRVCRGVARSCWRDIPTITANGDDDELLYEDDIAVLSKLKMFRRLEQADTLNRIGHFSVLFVGVQDGLDVSLPLGKAFGANSIDNVFFRAYSEDGVEVLTYDTEPSSPRFGSPETYQLMTRLMGNEKITVDTLARVVHHSRIVHMAEDALDNDFEGMSALEPIFNSLLDLVKASGGSAEAYWKNAQRILAFMAKEGVEAASDDELAALSLAIDEFTNGMRNGIRLGDIDMQSVDAVIADPKEIILGIFKIISGSTGIPLRILTGEGGGQTTGSEDKAAVNTFLKERQDLVCSDWLLQVMTILGKAGVIEEVPNDAVATWPVNEALNELEKSEVIKNRAVAAKDLSIATSGLGGLAGELSAEQGIEDILELEYKPEIDDGLSDEEVIVAMLPGTEDLNTGHLDDET